MYDYESVALFGDKLIAKRHSMSMGDEIYSGTGWLYYSTDAGKQADLRPVEMGKVEGRWMKQQMANRWC